MRHSNAHYVKRKVILNLELFALSVPDLDFFEDFGVFFLSLDEDRFAANSLLWSQKKNLF